MKKYVDSKNPHIFKLFYLDVTVTLNVAPFNAVLRSLYTSVAFATVFSTVPSVSSSKYIEGFLKT